MGFNVAIAGAVVREMMKILEERSFPVDDLKFADLGFTEEIERENVGWIVNTPSSGTSPRIDEIKMRAHAVIRGIPITTTL